MKVMKSDNTEQEETQAIPNKKAYVLRLIFTYIVIAASSYDLFATFVFGGIDYYWALLYVVPMLFGGGALLLVTLLTKQDPPFKINPKLSLAVSLIGVVVWFLYVIANCEMQGESAIGITNYTWPIFAFFGISSILMIIWLILSKKTGKEYPLLSYTATTITLFGFLLFAFFLSNQPFYVAGGILFALGGVAFFVQSLTQIEIH